MMIQVISNNVIQDTVGNLCRSIELSTEKKRIYIFIGTAYTSVCLQSSTTRMGNGRTFWGKNTLPQALASYKDGAIKAMISAAIEMI